MQLVLLVPLVTMRQFAEERRGGTLELLLTAPVREGSMVLAKFAASMAVLLAMIAFTFVYAFILGIFGNPDWGPVYSGYFGLVLLAGALVSIGLAVSALTTNQIVAAVVSLGIFGLLWAIDTWAALLPSPIDNWVLGLSLLARFTPFAVGCDVRLGFRLLPRAHPAWPFPHGPGAGATLTRWSTRRSIGRALLWVAGWLVAVLVLFCGRAPPAARDQARSLAGLVLLHRRSSSPRSAFGCSPMWRSPCTMRIST